MSKRFIILCLLMFGLFKISKATHIVGGDLTYKHIFKDSFEITLVLYVDCINGNPQAIALDSNAMIGVFDSTGILIKTLLKYRSLPERINSVNYTCTSPPSNVCVDKYVYKYYTTLPYRKGGYVLSFQRCCRNASINNITNPVNTGATFWASISDTTQTFGYNSSAVFKSLPPNFLCNKLNFINDHSASDADGDSLVYELYTPYIGGDPTNNLPRPPAAPPYLPVNWVAGYAATKMMGGNPELQIDPKTGLLMVKPAFIGQYVVGIAVKEYRRHKLINTTRRDFQFNVLTCQINIVSAFAQNIKVCSDTVNFTNHSIGADTYSWDFGDTSVGTDTSSLFQPTHIYPRAGVYQIKLKVSKGNCADSSLASVTILQDTAKFAGNDTLICIGSSVHLGITDTGAYTYRWSPSLYLSDSTIARPVSKPVKSITYIVKRVNDVCNNIDSINITVRSPKAAYTYDFITTCKDARIEIDTPHSGLSNFWFLNDLPITFGQLTAKSFTNEQTYKLRLKVSDGLCTDSFEQKLALVLGDTITLIPNVFTPNGDKWNDCYGIKNIALQKGCGHLLIYNRWGELMYDSDADGDCWDGTYKGNDADEGVYFFILHHMNKDYHGTISLLR